MSKKSGISRATISMLENDLQKVTSTKTLLKLAQALDKTIDQIFLKIVFNPLSKKGTYKTNNEVSEIVIKNRSHIPQRIRLPLTNKSKIVANFWYPIN